MNKLLIIIVVCFSSAIVVAQEKADILVGYVETAKNWESDTTYTTRMSLLANSRQSKYFNDLSLWSDSLSSTPEGEKRLKQIIMAACMTELPGGGISIDLRKGPVKKVHTYVFNSVPDRNITYYDKFGDEQSFYNEPAEEITWEIGDSTCVILGYECNVANANYHGRRWTAWFAPELPLPFGPWKLHGLPGLILKAEADNGASFTADGIEQTERIISPIYSPENYGRTERKKALRDAEYYLNNRESIIKAKHGNVQFNYNVADRPKYDARRYALEPDY